MNKKVLLLAPFLIAGMILGACTKTNKGSSQGGSSGGGSSSTSSSTGGSSQGGSSQGGSSQGGSSQGGSSEAGSSESTSSETAQHPYYAMLGTTEIAVDTDASAVLDTEQTGQYKATLGTVTGGTSISILNGDKQALSSDFGAEPGDNNVAGEVGSFTIANDASDAFLLIKTWQSGWTNFYVSGYVAPVSTFDYKVVGSGEAFGSEAWTYAGGVTFVADDKQEEIDLGWYKHQWKAEFHVDKNDEFKVWNGQTGDENWLGYGKFEANPNFEDNSGNIKAKKAGNVHLYYKIFTDDSVGLSATFTADPSTDPSYFVTLGSTEIEVFEDTTAVLVTDQTGQYRATLGNITAGTTLSIADSEKVALSSNFGAEPGDNNVAGDVGSFTIHNNAADAYILIKTWQSGWTNFYVSGYVAPTPDLTVTFTTTKEITSGQGVYLVGDFCSWSPANANAIKFTWGTGHVWTAADVPVVSGSTYHCKLVVAAYENPSDVIAWEKDGTGNERVITFSVSETMNLAWGSY